MSQKPELPGVSTPSSDNSGSARATTRPAPTKRPPKPLPQWRVLLHNDDVNTFEHVINSIVMLTPLNEQDAEICAQEADRTGLSLVLITHRERAELYKDQFESRSLTVTIEPEKD